jgi:hypothetical protein
VSEFTDILVAVHGIGDQSRNSTVRSVATRIAHSSMAIKRPNEDVPPVAPQPLGWFYTDERGAVRVCRLDKFESKEHPLAPIGFTEVFWADIPQGVVTEGRTLEETKAWARTVVARIRATAKKKVKLLREKKEVTALSAAEQLQLVEPDFSLAAEVLGEIIETVYVLENLFFIAEKAGLLKFHLKKVLDEYLGDVQIMTEFTLFRHDIIGRFHRAMQQIHDAYPDANLHIVAHSEGTVVSFLGLLHALSGEQFLAPAAEEDVVLDPRHKIPAWLEKIRGYMTIGSPIDKHILIWPDLFNFQFCQPAKELFKNRPAIKWRNYYDYGDPVGFQLDTAREWLRRHELRPFQFEKENDLGFARYLLPGKAHNDYWDDPAVFEHFIQDVVQPGATSPAAPPDRPLIGLLSPIIPYLFSAFLLLAATFVLYRTVTDYLHPDAEPLQRYLRFKVLGLAEAPQTSPLQILYNAAGISGLIAGVTLFARLPRLAAGWRWFAWGMLAFLGGCFCYCSLSKDWRAEIGQIFTRFGEPWPTLGVLVLAFAVGLISLLVLMPSHEFGRAQQTPRKQRWFRKGMRPLIFFGVVAIAGLIVGQVLPHSDLTAEERRFLPEEEVQEIDSAHLNRADLNILLWPQGKLRDPGARQIKTVGRVLSARPSLWPMLLGGAAFLYLWWLAALIFDLGFVWQRYIRQALGHKRLMLWSGYKSDPPESDGAAAASA